MGNDLTIDSYNTTTTSSASTTSTFEMLRQLSYESDVFLSDSAVNSHLPNVKKNGTHVTYSNHNCDVTLERFPEWRKDEIDPALLKYMKRSYKPDVQNVKISAKKLAELSASQKVPKFVYSLSSNCVKLHWACLVGWCMCKYQYQPMTPLHLMPHTRLGSNTNSDPIGTELDLTSDNTEFLDKPPLTSEKCERTSVTSETQDNISSSHVSNHDEPVIKLYEEESLEEIDPDEYIFDQAELYNIMTKESAV